MRGPAPPPSGERPDGLPTDGDPPMFATEGALRSPGTACSGPFPGLTLGVKDAFGTDSPLAAVSGDHAVVATGLDDYVVFYARDPGTGEWRQVSFLLCRRSMIVKGNKGKPHRQL